MNKWLSAAAADAANAKKTIVVPELTKPKSLAIFTDSLKKNKKIVIPVAVLSALGGIYALHANSEKNKIAHATALDLLEQYINTDETRRLRGAN